MNAFSSSRLSFASILSLLALCALAAPAMAVGGCAPAVDSEDSESVEPDEDEEEQSEPPVVEVVPRRAAAEQVIFKSGRPHRRRVPWSSAPAHAADGGYVWSRATRFREVEEAWWGTGLPARTVAGYEAFPVGERLHEQIWVVNPDEGGRTERYDRTRDVRTEEVSPWAPAMKDTDIPGCSGADCRVTSWSLTVSGGKMIEIAWRGPVAKIRTSEVQLDEAGGTYAVIHQGEWGTRTTADLPFPPGDESSAGVLLQQGYQLGLDAPVGTIHCEGEVRAVYGYLTQAWFHADDRGYGRTVPVGPGAAPYWECANPTGAMHLSQLEAASPELPEGELGDASLHLLHEEE